MFDEDALMDLLVLEGIPVIGLLLWKMFR